MSQALWASEHAVDKLERCQAVSHEGDLICSGDGLDSKEDGGQFGAQTCVELGIMVLKLKVPLLMCARLVYACRQAGVAHAAICVEKGGSIRA